ncbi:MAG: copper chaperone PCu(A)C [Asticcacaulis sp.]
MKFAALLVVAALVLAGCHAGTSGQSSWSTVVESTDGQSHVRILIQNPAIRASLGGSANTAAYMTIENQGNQPDRLLSASCDCAAKVMLHATSPTGGMMMMQDMADGFAIAPGEKLVFKPGGNHVMLEGLKAPLKDGTVQSVNLTFARAGTVAVAMPVQTAPAPDDK